MEGELGYINDPVSYTAWGFKQVQPCQTGYKGEDRLTATLGPLGWGLGEGLTTPPRKDNNMLPELRGLMSQT